YTVDVAIVVDLSDRELGREAECLADEDNCLFFLRHRADVPPGSDADEGCRDDEYGCHEVGHWCSSGPDFGSVTIEYEIAGEDPLSACQLLRTVAIPLAGGPEITMLQDCTMINGTKYSPELPLGNYEISVTLVDSEGTELSDTTTRNVPGGGLMADVVFSPL
ncbi:MAG: hypothetical protein KJO07_08775, partial [Deltaproteobacteria bacterium]|nr:hypothetical protein [Deltaproteobacteria bacterium]